MIIGVDVQLYYCGTMMVCSLNNDFIFNEDNGKLLYLVSKRCVRGDSSVLVDCERQRVLILLNDVEARRVFQAVYQVRLVADVGHANPGHHRANGCCGVDHPIPVHPYDRRTSGQITESCNIKKKWYKNKITQKIIASGKNVFSKTWATRTLYYS